MKTFVLDVVTPDTAIREPEAVALDIPADNGRLTVLAGHQPLVCAVRSGSLHLTRADATREEWSVESGTLRVRRDGVTLLARGLRRLAVSAGEPPV